MLNSQLEEAHNIIVKKGIIVDVNVIDIPLPPKGKTNYKVTEETVKINKRNYASSIGKNGT